MSQKFDTNQIWNLSYRHVLKLSSFDTDFYRTLTRRFAPPSPGRERGGLPFRDAAGFADGETDGARTEEAQGVIAGRVDR